MYIESTLPIDFKDFSVKKNMNITQSSFDSIGSKNCIITHIKQWMQDPYLQETDIVNKDIWESKEKTLNFNNKNADSRFSNNIRIHLLARKYISNHLSSEEEARLQIESERVKRLMPLVTDDDIKEIRNALEELGKIKKRNAKIKKYLGMK